MTLHSNHPVENKCQHCVRRTFQYEQHGRNSSLFLGGRGEPALFYCLDNTADFEWVIADLHCCAWDQNMARNKASTGFRSEDTSSAGTLRYSRCFRPLFRQVSFRLCFTESEWQSARRWLSIKKNTVISYSHIIICHGAAGTMDHITHTLSLLLFLMSMDAR